MQALITKLPGSVTDSDLLKLGEFVIEFDGCTKNKTITPNVGSNELAARILGDGHFWTDNTYSVNAGKSITIPAGTTKKLYTSAGTYKLIISGKYQLRELSIGNYLDERTVKIANIEDLLMGPTQNLLLFDAVVGGNIKSLSGKSSFISLLSIRGNIEGNIDDIDGPINFFNTINIQSNEKLVGNIASLGKFITLGTVNFKDTSVSGTYQDLAAAMASNGRTSGSCSITAADGITHVVNFPYSP
jgi:hypothetical protein